MMGGMTTYSLSELAETAGVTPRTVRYYIVQGLLPAPASLGPNARYERRHLDRLQLVRRLQDEGLALAKIRARLAELSDDEIAELVGSVTPPAGESAIDYVRSVLAGQRTPRAVPAAPAARRHDLRSQSPFGIAAQRVSDARPRAAPDATAVSASGPPPPPRAAPDRSQWERVALDPDIEIHIRRPLGRDQNRRIERLLAAARRIFEEGSSS
jgi:DNA-binding transcriptional MerR regulator